MSVAEGFVTELETTRKFFLTSLSTFGEEDSGFAPKPGLYSIAGHVAHTAQTIEWFVDGAFGDGWDMDFDQHIAEAREVESLEAATRALVAAFERAVEVIGGSSDADLFTPIADTRIMEGAPRAAIVSAITDHTAHHRGALAVYARMLGKEPVMPYA